jgi:hypothetical protein
MGDFFLLKFPIKKAMISCSEVTLEDVIMGLEDKGDNDLDALMHRKSRINLDYEQVFPLVLVVLDFFSFKFFFLYELITFCLYNFVAYKVQDDSFLLSKGVLSQFIYKTFVAILFQGHC